MKDDFYIKFTINFVYMVSLTEVDKDAISYLVSISWVKVAQVHIPYG